MRIGPRDGEERHLVGEIKGYAAVAFAQRLDAGPGDLPGSDERIEIAGLVVGDARGQDSGLDKRGGDRRALQLLDDVQKRVHSPAGRKQALPVGEEAGQGLLLDRLDFFAQPGKRFAADDAQNFGIDPLAMQAAGTEASFDDAVFGGEMIECLLGLRRVQGKAESYFVEGKRSVGAGVAADEFEDRLGDWFEQRGGDAGRERNAETVAVAGAVFNGHEAFFAGDAEFQDAPGADQPFNRFEDFGTGDAQGQFFASKVAETQKHVVEAVRGAGAIGIDEALLLLFDLGYGVAVEKLAQIGFAEQLAELVLIDGEGLGAAFG